MDEETASPFRTPERMNKQEDNKPRRNSAGKVMSSDGKQKELPRYLRASTGSCHDLCKYGRKNVSEEKPWRSKVKKTVKKLPDGMNESFSSGSSERKRVMAVKMKQELHCSDDASEIIKRELVKTTKSKLKSSPVSGSQTSGNANTTEKQKVVSKRSHSGRAAKKSNDTNPTHVQVSSPGLKPLKGKASRGNDNDMKIEKNIGASKVVSKKVSLTPRASFSSKPSIRLAGNSSLRKSQSLKASSSPPNQKPSNVQCSDEPKQLDSYPLEEKTLHVVEMEAENYKIAEEHDPNEKLCIADPSPPSSSSTQEDEDVGEYEEYTVSEAEGHDYQSQSDEPETAEEEDETLDGEEKPRGRNEGKSADEAQKLHFRRGRVVDVNSENGKPTRLKFRRGRALGENQTQNSHGRRSFKKVEHVAEDNDEHEEEKVVLRHQDVEEKKDGQGLFNNVIEATASKLVESRKSKVKALVGAFETVISLQESKPSSNSAT
ncbi:PREDICTED: hepatoma-derived growth factor-related protein 2-like [Tarenaya hassleriana]|uniref:hepatoma-derived growth factor-related protein 2-like n=1 Tax=Tarenaya hassleriana TaxID=28532 RepID=UPI00053C7C92|nr:PREDICTED: hepatoma-derived growth factor-related protein 2-like [Tarenaya hassleriana]XP_010553980.1 PREDICTED: hepatoma-derived growth factor-related protein 2-like [Tarenaya hassleriana]XP_010553982.1 PREDICTED: hepatoma-derived growth factor-related protein 2-like [Tarenaya hassleriana]XP_010553983.1 PREDICTED: hepatoma-derived growth factor-related protein 2-like [Tarenaya hassleriana]XP_010553984.1 PREDICTED: hepatoma-derived growth factor-related protein 2-like [Tarenaya hassleriana]